MNKKTIWITGASSGIGKALTFEYAKTDVHLIISSRKEALLNEVKAACSNPDRVFVLPLDLEKQDELESKVTTALSFTGQVDVLINNGGLSQRSLVKDTTLDVHRRLMEVNYLGTVALSVALLPHFVQRQSGHFAVVTSLMGKFGAPMRAGYAGAKHALHGFFDTLRAEHHKDNVKVTLICPGFVHTNISMNAMTKDGQVQNSMDNATSKGISAEKCASKIAKAIRRGKDEVYIGRKEILAVYLKRFFPSILNSVVRRVNTT